MAAALPCIVFSVYDVKPRLRITVLLAEILLLLQIVLRGLRWQAEYSTRIILLYLSAKINAYE
jgi:hypothetical protein